MEGLFNEINDTISMWSSCGEKRLSTGVRLICPTPHIAPEAWLHVVFPPVTVADISSLESDLKTVLPEEYKDFLLRTNGVELFSNNIAVWGIRKSMSRSGDDAWQPFDLRNHNRPSDRPASSPNSVIYFGSIGRGQNRCFFEPSDDSYVVGATDRHQFKPFNYWSDFGEWLLDEMGKLKQRFDSAGVMLP